jgi:acyl-CoA reductase-like NAD-dependent aldehyde dehydrogenase
VIGDFQEAGQADVGLSGLPPVVLPSSIADLAVDAARRAFDDGPWSTLSGTHRRDLMLKLALLVEQNADELALAEARDNGLILVSISYLSTRQASL